LKPWRTSTCSAERFAHVALDQKLQNPSSTAYRAHRRLTHRSSGAPTAGHQGPATGRLYIICGRALASCRCRPLSSNVRRRRGPMRYANRVSALRRELNSHEKANSRRDSAPPSRDIGRRLNDKVWWHHKRTHLSKSDSASLRAVPKPSLGAALPSPTAALRRSNGFQPVHGAAGSNSGFWHRHCWRLETVAHQHLRRGAVSTCGTRPRTTEPQLHCAPRTSPPNPSLKGSANGRPPGPPAGVVYHPAVGPGVLPSSPP
jgi:hypothetical protein